MRLLGREVPLSALSFRPLENLDLKLISFALAVGLWSLVPDATTPHMVRGVPVQLESIPSDLALTQPFEQTLDVLVRGPTVRARTLIPGELSPRIDLFGAHPGQNVVTIAPGDIPTPFGVSVQSIEPSRVQVILAQRVRETRPVNIVLEGSPAPGYEIRERISEPATVAVEGARPRVEALDDVVTEVVSVTGLTDTFSRSVNVFTDDPLVEVANVTQVRLTIVIEEVPITSQIDEVPLEVVDAAYRVAVNPERIGVVLRGPPSVLESVTVDNLRAIIDASDLVPRAEDYRIEPRIVLSPEALRDRLEVIALTPQRLIDVHVFDQPAED